ncbi:MAG: hypothetical protein ACI9BD_000924 [Candidatus Marinamargulisbacteria bacterium]|jgi:hypothetical protein
MNGLAFGKLRISTDRATLGSPSNRAPQTPRSPSPKDLHTTYTGKLHGSGRSESPKQRFRAISTTLRLFLTQLIPMIEESVERSGHFSPEQVKDQARHIYAPFIEEDISDPLTSVSNAILETIDEHIPAVQANAKTPPPSPIDRADFLTNTKVLIDEYVIPLLHHMSSEHPGLSKIKGHLNRLEGSLSRNVDAKSSEALRESLGIAFAVAVAVAKNTTR